MTFIAKQLSDGTTAIRCRETNQRFIIADALLYKQSAAYLDGQLIKVGSRLACLLEIERTVKWSMA